MTEKDSKAKIRRKSRAVDDDNWIIDFLKKASYGTLATADDNQPFLNINTFVYDESENAIYFHGAQKGRTRSNIDNNSKVCYGVSNMGRLLPAKSANEFSVEYSSVIIFGRVEIVTDKIKARKGLSLLMKKYFPRYESGKDFQPVTDRDLKITSVYKIIIDEWSGKRKEVDPDFPGAFLFENRFGK
ncbi:MAG: pyridoxamine 5'-phosphate oxidase family protein [candidate division Zixibacteria bacterium]